MNQKAYLVLSVEDIRELLQVAEKSMAKYAGVPSHTIVLDGLEILTDSNGEFQISVVSVWREIRRIDGHLTKLATITSTPSTPEV